MDYLVVRGRLVAERRVDAAGVVEALDEAEDFVPRIGCGPEALPVERNGGRVNHGKESSKFNQDCTICPSCRSTPSAWIVSRWRENPNRLAGIQVGLDFCRERSSLSAHRWLFSVPRVPPC